MNPKQNEPLNLISNDSIPPNMNRRVSPSTMEQAISLLRKQLRQCKIQRQLEKQTHKEQSSKYKRQIQSLRQKILSMKQKQYLKTILVEEVQQQRLKQNSLFSAHKKLKLYTEKLEIDLKRKDEQIEKLKQEQMDLNNEKHSLLKEKEKHLELSIIEKINLQERILVLQKQVLSKENLANLLKQQGTFTTNKQIQLKKLERKLVKKVNEVEHYEEQMKNFKSFQTQKLNTRIQTLQKQNAFLKQHIRKIQDGFNSTNECLCSSNQCKKQIDMFKNKFINKSRELSKVKVEMSKQIFKEQFLRDVKNKQNITPVESIKIRSRAETLAKQKDLLKQKKFDYGLSTSKKQNDFKDYQSDDILLFKLTENDEDNSFNEKTLPTSSLSKYKSQMIKRKQTRPIDYR